MQITDEGEGVKFKLKQSEIRALRSKQFLIRRLGRNIDGELGERLIAAADALEQLERDYPQANTERLDHEDEAVGVPE